MRGHQARAKASDEVVVAGQRGRGEQAHAAGAAHDVAVGDEREVRAVHKHLNHYH